MLSLKENVLNQEKHNLFSDARSYLGAENECSFKSALQDRLLHRFLRFALPEC